MAALQKSLGRTPYAEIGSAVAICDQGKVFRLLHTMNGDVFQIQDQSSLKGFTVFGEGETSARWGYRSKVHDPTGLIYFGRRYYDPSSGRFITPDPEGYLDGPNLYTYALNNPLVFHDPYGLFADSLFEVDRWKEIGIAVYHGSVSYARDTTIFAGKYLGGIHGLEDMPFADIYSAHLDANDRFVKKTDDWMASSPYANSDLYHRTHGVTYAGMDIAAGFFFPFGKVKTAASTGKAILKAERIVHSSPTLLKTSQVTGKVFKSSKQGSHLKDAVKPIWTSTKKGSSVKNAYKHWKEHGKNFQELLNAKQYVEAAHRFTQNPPIGVLKIVRSNGDTVFYHRVSQTFAITNKSGIPRTMYKPHPSRHDHQTWNISMHNKLACRICGLMQDEPPWGEDGKNANHAICACCGAEFGYEDFTLEGVKDHRRQWINGKAKWFNPKKRPENWSLEEQMKNIPEEFR